MPPRHLFPDVRRHREQLLARARGRVLDLGGGRGEHLGDYRDVDSVVVLSPGGAAAPGLARARVPVVVIDGAVDALASGAESFDTVVSVFTLCSGPGTAPAVRALAPLLHDSGQLLFLEHTRAVGLRALLQSVSEPLHRAGRGCALRRDIPAAIREAGMVITDLQRFPLLSYAAAGVSGAAVRKSGPTA